MINKVVGELSGSTIAKIGLNMAKPGNDGKWNNADKSAEL